MSSFALDLSKAIEKAKDHQKLVAKKIMIDLFSSVIEKSPVGNPELWKEPKKGYVGGRFRANWNVAYGSPDTSTTKDVDTSGTQSISRMEKKVGSYEFNDGSVFLSNSLPYSLRLEYDSWSKQAPAGMVRISLIEIQNTYGA